MLSKKAASLDDDDDDDDDDNDAFTPIGAKSPEAGFCI
jgi:hypothetical protein